MKTVAVFPEPHTRSEDPQNTIDGIILTLNGKNAVCMGLDYSQITSIIIYSNYVFYVFLYI